MTFIPLLPSVLAKHMPDAASPFSGSTDTGGASPVDSEPSPVNNVAQKVFSEIKEEEEGKVEEPVAPARPLIPLSINFPVNLDDGRLSVALRGVAPLEFKRSDFSSWTFLSRGGSADVSKAVHDQSGVTYAIKTFYSFCKERPRQEYFIRELTLAAGFDHPNIVRTLGYFKDEGDYYLVMDYMSGGDLFDKVIDSEKLDLETIKLYTPQIASGISYLHDKGILYRDLKLENILLDESLTRVRLTDFGIVKPMSDSERTMTECGSESYLSPEMVLGQKGVGRGYGFAADWWAFGIALYIMTVGYPPFRGESPLDIYRQVLKADLVFPEEISNNPEYSTLMDLIHGLLEKDPAVRLQEETLLHPFLVA